MVCVVLPGDGGGRRPAVVCADGLLMCLVSVQQPAVPVGAFLLVSLDPLVSPFLEVMGRGDVVKADRSGGQATVLVGDQAGGFEGGQGVVAGGRGCVSGGEDVAGPFELLVDDQFVDAPVAVADDFPCWVDVFDSGGGDGVAGDTHRVLVGQGVVVGFAALGDAGAY